MSRGLTIEFHCGSEILLTRISVKIKLRIEISQRDHLMLAHTAVDKNQVTK